MDASCAAGPWGCCEPSCWGTCQGPPPTVQHPLGSCSGDDILERMISYCD